MITKHHTHSNIEVGSAKADEKLLRYRLAKDNEMENMLSAKLQENLI